MSYLAALPKCTGLIWVLYRLIERVVMFSTVASCLNMTTKNSGLMLLKLKLRSRLLRQSKVEKSKYYSKEWSILNWLLAMFSYKSCKDVRFVRMAFNSDLKPTVVNWLLNRQSFTSKEREKESSSACSSPKLSKWEKDAYRRLDPSQWWVLAPAISCIWCWSNPLKYLFRFAWPAQPQSGWQCSASKLYSQCWLKFVSGWDFRVCRWRFHYWTIVWAKSCPWI